MKGTVMTRQRRSLTAHEVKRVIGMRQEGHSVKAIAQRLDVPFNSVKRTVVREGMDKRVKQ